MKKLLLTLAAVGAIVTASAAVADLSKVWNTPVENAYKAEAKEWNAPVAVDAEGNVIATGAFTEDFTIAGANLEAIGTSAYVVKYDKTGKAAWAVAFTGAATITAIDTDADGNIYIAGSFADEVILGTTSGQSATIEGLKIDEAFTSNLAASFIAKYDNSGKLLANTTFVPQPIEEIPYTPSGEDMQFYINHILLDGTTLYASATFTGITEKDGVKFDGSYNDALGLGFLYKYTKGIAVFTLNSNLSGCSNVISCTTGTPQAADSETTFEFEAVSGTFTVADGNIYCAFIGNGPLSLKAADDTKIVDSNYLDYNYILTSVKSGKINEVATIKCNDFGAYPSFDISNVFVNNTNIYVIGSEPFTDQNNRSGNEIFVFNSSADNLTGAQKKVFEFISGDITYYDVASAAILSTGEMYINTLGRYNNTKKEGEETIFSKGDFANVAKSFVFANDAFAPATTVTDAVGVAAAGSYVAFSQIGETGATFSLYNDAKASGINDIVTDENAEAEYFNLQGVKVANPENGLYIVRRGNKVTKEIIR